jgi:hypothetical protein
MTTWDQTDPWETSTGFILPAGNHVVKIDRAEAGKSSGNYPQIELQLSNSSGELRDWVVVTEAGFGKVVALAMAAGVQPTDEEKAYFDENGLEPPQSFVSRLEGREVGIVAREEPSFKDPNKTIVKVQGYVSPDKIKGGSETTPAGAAQAFATAGSNQSSDVDVPF